MIIGDVHFNNVAEYRQRGNALCFNRYLYFSLLSYGSLVNRACARAYTHTLWTVSFSRAVHNHLQLVIMDERKRALLTVRAISRITSRNSCTLGWFFVSFQICIWWLHVNLMTQQVTLGKTPLHEWSALGRDFYLVNHICLNSKWLDMWLATLRLAFNYYPLNIKEREIRELSDQYNVT